MSPARRFLPPLVPAAVLLAHVTLMYRAALRVRELERVGASRSASTIASRRPSSD